MWATVGGAGGVGVRGGWGCGDDGTGMSLEPAGWKARATKQALDAGKKSPGVFGVVGTQFLRLRFYRFYFL